MTIGKRSLTSDAKVDMTRFAEYDMTADRTLDFAEFLAMMPPGMLEQYTEEQIRSWFAAADRSGKGAIDIHDYWRWSLGNLAQKHGTSALRACGACR